MPRKERYVSKELRDMKAVWDQPESMDRGHAQYNLRQMLKDDRARYLVQMHKLEAEHRAKRAEIKKEQKKEAAKPEQVVDEGQERIEELLAQILQRAEE